MISSQEAYEIVKELRNWKKSADDVINELDSKIRDLANAGDTDIDFQVSKTDYPYFNLNSLQFVKDELEKEEVGYFVTVNPVTYELNISWDKDKLSDKVETE